MNPWVTAGILLVAAMVIFICLPNRQALSNNYVRRRSDEHEAMVGLLREWLDDPRIRHALTIEDGAGRAADAAEPILAALYLDVGEMAENHVRETVAVLLRRRTTRRLVASYMERHHGAPAFWIRRQLAVWADWKEDAA